MLDLSCIIITQLLTFWPYQGSTVCQEGGRYKLVSDGDNNNMIMLAITKVKTTDEGEYRVVVENCHGSDEKSFMLYVSGQLGLSYRLNILAPLLTRQSIRMLDHGLLEIDEAFSIWLNTMSR